MTTECTVIDEYCVKLDGKLFVRKIEKDSTREEKKNRRSKYMKRYRADKKTKTAKTATCAEQPVTTSVDESIKENNGDLNNTNTNAR